MTVLLKKIMDYFQLKLLIFSIISCRVSGETSWGSDKARYDGYDLHKGPVFYEAYYADDSRPKLTEPQQFQRNVRPETENLNGGMMEKIYQTAGESSLNSANWKSDETRATIDRYYDQQNELARSNFMVTKNNAQIQNEENLRFVKNRRFDEEYIRPILSAIENSAREILIKEFEKVSQMQDASEDMTISRSPSVANLENRISDGRRVLIGNSDSTNHPNQPRSFDQRFGSGDWKNWRANDFFMDHNRLKEATFPSPIPCKTHVPEENHFQPQVSNYVMSATVAPTREQAFLSGRESSVKLPQSQPLTQNYWPTRNIIERDVGIRQSNQNTQKSNDIVPGVASIEISEMPRHKTRHHHGEKPRPNKHRRHAPGH